MPGSYAESTQCNHWLFSEQDIAERRGRRTRSPVRRPAMLRWDQCIPTPGFPPFVLVHSPLSACVYLAAIGGGCTLPWRDKYICHATQTPLASKQAFVQRVALVPSTSLTSLARGAVDMAVSPYPAGATGAFVIQSVGALRQRLPGCP